MVYPFLIYEKVSFQWIFLSQKKHISAWKCYAIIIKISKKGSYQRSDGIVKKKVFKA